MLMPSLVFAAALVGGGVLCLGRWSERRLHVALALSTGTFLGAVFLHLLPGVSALPEAGGHLHGPLPPGTPEHHDGLASPWLFVLLGVLIVHLVEAVFLRSMEREGQARHESVGLVTVAGITVHAASAGLGLAALDSADALTTSLIAAFLFHKAFESFAVVNVHLLAHKSLRFTVSVLVAFALVTPLSMLVGDELFRAAGDDVVQVVFALATGTFLYVCVAELLPEVFHHRGDELAKTLLLAAGIALTVVFEGLGA